MLWSRSLAISCICLFLFSSHTFAFYLPGVAPHDYEHGAEVKLYVNSLTPLMGSHQLKSLIPYDYYYKPFHFCSPEEPQSQSESLGSILFGDRIFDSLYKLNMAENTTCQYLCSVTVPGEDAAFINARIKENYAINWLIDGLPAASRKRDLRTDTEFNSIGFELGDSVASFNNPPLHNHYDIEIQYHKQESANKYRVVGVIVSPTSNKYDSEEHAKTCEITNERLILDEKNDNLVHYTYKVIWTPSNIAWATRWDNYLHTFDPRIHWFSLVNSIVIVLFLTGMVAMILLRALHKDISRYNQLEAQEDVQEDFGWKLVHGDIFRTPANIMLLSVFLGNGSQLFCMTTVTLLFAVLGFLSPSNRGSLATVMLIFYMLFAFVAGYVSARIYKMFGGDAWKKNVFLTAFLFPTIEHPVRTNQIPRQIPDQVFYLRPIPSMLMGGVLPFGAIFIELYFIMNSIWGSKDYHWSWRAFLTSGASGFYIFVYSIMYFMTRLQINSLTSAVIYFGWSGALLVISLALHLSERFL
ncbi:11788_t:CDS:2 [Dentiscutata heterogama]|uniref:11788_t:CDS:1 n=1 Tax=Dentiscutata heterogama TaxID=1316150 RepID=A0ACA9KLN9_9GLOM|nr:11788_t:CDS:2 [Dentiscutata heterogama]